VIQIRRNAIVRQSAQRMFDLVNDVESYPRRFSWCSGAQVVSREPAALVAKLDLRVAGMTLDFTTRNTLDPPHRISMQLAAGPFRELRGAWEFAALGEDGCKVSLALDFDYAGSFMAPVMRAGFEKLADRMVDEFCREALRDHG
jgi:ribosome-associated toxin RatA of RatAB toxin-antitoxin module